MICQAHDEQLGDYVDGTLPAAEIARLEAHLADCSRCRALAADFRTIRSMARSLEPHVPPPHVWQHVSDAARTSGRWPSLGAFFVTWSAGTPGRVPSWQPAAATAMALLIAAGLWWVGNRLSAIVPASSGPAGVTASSHPAFGSAPLAAEVHYTSAIASLEALTGAERAALDPGMIDVLDGGMTIIDGAIDQSRAALETEPDSEVAQESLFQALRSKVALLQDTLALVNEMRTSRAAPLTGSEMTP
jgi:hypothetical protein